MGEGLESMLDSLRITTTLFGIADLPHDWGVEFPGGQGAYFHVVWGGAGWLHIAGSPPRRIAAEQVALLPHGTAHRMTSTREGIARVRFDPERWQPNEIAGRTDRSATGMQLICAAVHTTARPRALLLELMPEVFLADGLGAAVAMLRDEAASGLDGREILLARMGDVLLVQLVRAWLHARDPGDDGWLAALRDDQIGPVLVAVHADPAAPWTLSSMATLASLSRSRFAERFQSLLGISPIAYVTRWRLDSALGLLRDGHSVRYVSGAVGYTSEASFSRAFTRYYGDPPSRVPVAAT